MWPARRWIETEALVLGLPVKWVAPRQWRIAVRSDRHHAARMAKPAPSDFALVPEYRVVVRASGAARRGFIWEIVHSDKKVANSVKETSAQSFRTMEAAFNDGTAALAKWHKT